jgi:hypothetical protein
MAWYEALGNKKVLVKEVIDPNFGGQALVEELEGAVFCRGGLNTKAVGKWLGKHKERRVNGLRFVQLGGDKNGLVWMVEKD